MDHRDKSALFCSFCHRTRHEVDNCFTKSGKFPDWWETRNRRGAGRGRGTAGGNSFDGALVADSSTNKASQVPVVGTSKGRGGVEVRNTVAAVGSSGDGASFSNGHDNVALPGMTSSPWQQFLNLLGNSTPKPTDDRLMGEYFINPWIIIDTGASMHVTGNIKLLSNLVNIPECPVGLPDGNKSFASKCGKARLSHGLVLKNVLYVPQLNCNLISVSHLSDDLNFVVQFTNNLCVIQDRTLRTLIGVGERRDGLY